jgi:hypothetical protein
MAPAVDTYASTGLVVLGLEGLDAGWHSDAPMEVKLSHAEAVSATRSTA